jgi:hypothetical protein
MDYLPEGDFSNIICSWREMPEMQVREEVPEVGVLTDLDGCARTFAIPYRW